MADTQAPLPEGWGAYQDAEGRTYYANPATGQTCWEPPAASLAASTPEPPAAPSSGYELPAGWGAHQDPEGRTYYHHAETGQTSWEPPTLAAAMAPEQPAGQQWSTVQTYTLGQEGFELTPDGQAVLLDKAIHTSVTTAIDALNSGTVQADAGYCVIYSVNRQTYYLLWREDKMAEAFAALNIGAEFREPWSASQCYTIGPDGSEYLFEGKVELLEKAQYCSVTQAVEALNAGLVMPQDGLCVVYSTSKQTYYLLYRDDKCEEVSELASTFPGQHGTIAMSPEACAAIPLS